jgi:GTP-sensing pleiotropic transcriptional regulator CodY
MKNSDENMTTKATTYFPTNAYVLWKTGEVLGFDMKQAAIKLGVGSTAFKTNMRNRYVCKIKLTEITNKLKNTQDNVCLTSFNSENYHEETKQYTQQ